MIHVVSIYESPPWFDILKGETNKAIETLEKSVLVFYDVDIESDLADPNLLFWYVSILLYICFFRMSQNFRKWGEYVTFFICLSHILRFYNCLIENNMRYNICIFNFLGFYRDWENYIIAKLRDIPYPFCITNQNQWIMISMVIGYYFYFLVPSWMRTSRWNTHPLTSRRLWPQNWSWRRISICGSTTGLCERERERVINMR